MSFLIPCALFKQLNSWLFGLSYIQIGLFCFILKYKSPSSSSDSSSFLKASNTSNLNLPYFLFAYSCISLRSFSTLFSSYLAFNATKECSPCMSAIFWLSLRFLSCLEWYFSKYSSKVRSWLFLAKAYFKFLWSETFDRSNFYGIFLGWDGSFISSKMRSDCYSIGSSENSEFGFDLGLY